MLADHTRSLGQQQLTGPQGLGSRFTPLAEEDSGNQQEGAQHERATDDKNENDREQVAGKKAKTTKQTGNQGDEMDSLEAQAFQDHKENVSKLLDDHLDEPCMQKLADYEGKKFVSIQKADVKLDESEDEKMGLSKIKDMYKPLNTDFTEKDALKDSSDKIERVEISKRLTKSPVEVQEEPLEDSSKAPLPEAAEHLEWTDEEVEQLTATVAAKTKQISDLGLARVGIQQDWEGSKTSLAYDEQFLQKIERPSKLFCDKMIDIMADNVEAKAKRVNDLAVALVQLDEDLNGIQTSLAEDRLCLALAVGGLEAPAVFELHEHQVGRKADQY